MKEEIKYEQVVLQVYSNIDSQIQKFSEKILNMALSSFDGKIQTEKQMEKIASICEKRNILKDLKFKIDLVLSRFSDVEKKLLFFKSNNLSYNDFKEFSRRTFFRKRNQAMEKFKEYLGFVGLSKKEFSKKYSNFAIVQFAICDNQITEEKKLVA